jgi:hypothetical protein
MADRARTGQVLTAAPSTVSQSTAYQRKLLRTITDSWGSFEAPLRRDRVGLAFHRGRERTVVDHWQESSPKREFAGSTRAGPARNTRVFANFPFFVAYLAILTLT